MTSEKLERLDREAQEASDKSIRRDIVIGMAKALFIENALSNRGTYPRIAQECLEVAEIWADAQIAYCEKNNEA
jgi:hypothetical protein